jgi:hypothetical protein
MQKSYQFIFGLFLYFQCSFSPSHQGNGLLLGTAVQEPEILVAIPLDIVSQIEKQIGEKLEFEVVESFIVEEIFKGVNAEVIIERIIGWDDPGDFHQIRIVSQEKEVSFFNAGGWVRISDFETQRISKDQNERLRFSDFFFLYRDNPNNNLILVFGYPYASQPGLLSIIKLSGFPEPKLILNDFLYFFGFDEIKSKGVLNIKVSKGEMDNFENLKTKSIKLKNGGK